MHFGTKSYLKSNRYLRKRRKADRESRKKTGRKGLEKKRERERGVQVCCCCCQAESFVVVKDKPFIFKA
jgi:hypothetical protein